MTEPIRRAAVDGDAAAARADVERAAAEGVAAAVEGDVADGLIAVYGDRRRWAAVGVEVGGVLAAADHAWSESVPVVVVDQLGWPCPSCRSQP